MKFIKLCLGILLLPAACGALFGSVRMTGELVAYGKLTFPFLIGFAGYPVLWLYGWTPQRIYVFGHETMHALAAWMHGAKVLRLVVGKRSGHVDLTHSNALIALAPYVVPFYTVLTVLAYRVLMLVWVVPPQWRGLVHATFLALVGLSFSFHFVHTLEAIWGHEQPDLAQAGGLVFSMALIALWNGLALTLILKCLFPGTVSASRALGPIWSWTWLVWTQSAIGLRELSGWTYSRFRTAG